MHGRLDRIQAYYFPAAQSSQVSDQGALSLSVRERALILFALRRISRAIWSKWGFRVKFAVPDLSIYCPIAAHNGDNIIISTICFHRQDSTALFQLALVVVSLLFRHAYAYQIAYDTASQSANASSAKCCQQNAACDSRAESWNEECCCRA